MKVSEQSGIAATKVNQILWLIRRTITYTEKQLIVSLHKAVVRPQVHQYTAIPIDRLHVAVALLHGSVVN